MGLATLGVAFFLYAGRRAREAALGMGDLKILTIGNLSFCKNRGQVLDLRFLL